MNTKMAILAAVIAWGAGVGGEATTAAPAADVNAVVAGNTAFACDLYARLKTTSGNLFFSPYSISTALAMTAGGARGATGDANGVGSAFAGRCEYRHCLRTIAEGPPGGGPEERMPAQYRQRSVGAEGASVSGLVPFDHQGRIRSGPESRGFRAIRGSAPRPSIPGSSSRPKTRSRNSSPPASWMQIRGWS